MGGRGSSYSRSTNTLNRMGYGSPPVAAPQLQMQPTPAQPQPPQPPVAQQPPSPQNTPATPNALDALSNMTDDQLAALMVASRRADMPNHLNDVADATQRFVFQAGLNEKPTVLDDASFAQFMQTNNIPQSQIMSRTVGGAVYSVNGTNYKMQPQQVVDMMKYSALNYVGGKQGGMVHGAGTYFDMNGGSRTGYGSGNTVTALAVLNPATAKVIDHSALNSRVSSFARSHPKFAAAVGAYNSHNMSIYALAMGYNVIRYGSYNNVIDRSALVYRQSNL